ncbi:MAG TPA: RNA polymerase sigma factor [Chitinivibrionales bacterium]|nr:RNA polymerase sigma factor [Chitinivibrionales bacterium]
MPQTSDYTTRARSDGTEGAMQDTRLLLQQCLKNDRRAQRELFNCYKHKVHDLVYKSLGPKFDTDDVLQQVFIELFKSLAYFKGDSSLDTWVYRIGAKVCTTQLRKKYRKRQPQVVYDTEQMEAEADPSANGPSADLEQRELEASIYDALDKLDAEKRMTVVMYEMEGRSLEEIAEMSNIPLGTVKSRLFHGRKTLEKLLKRHVEH